MKFKPTVGVPHHEAERLTLALRAEHAGFGLCTAGDPQQHEIDEARHVDTVFVVVIGPRVEIVPRGGPG
ncbi:MAG: hypothetical protein ACR2PH_00465, partial [Desulfobulbia bacterium]